MPTWGEILQELNTEIKNNPDRPVCDIVRRKYLKKLYQYTKRDTIIYATDWTSPRIANADLISITEEDMHGLMEVMHGLRGKELDLIIHSPGGSAEAAEAIASYLRSKFPDDIRVIVPHAAMSAATMLACSGDRIVMGKHSFLGPIDPQFVLDTELGRKMVPAQAIIDQFNWAQSECKNPQLLGSWMPMLPQYGPALLAQCENAIDLSEELVKKWLEKYMFKGRKDAKRKAAKVAKSLSDHRLFKSHARHISRDKAEAMGLIIEPLEGDQTFQDLVLSVFHSTLHTFNNTAATKIIENHEGKAFIKQLNMAPMPRPTVPEKKHKARAQK